MRLTHFGHSCLLAEMDGTRILFDPGNFSHGFEGVTGLDAILVTHQHPDHADIARLPSLVEANPKAALYADPQTASQLGGAWQAVRPGEHFTVGSVDATVGGGRHAVIHPDIPVIDNVAYLLGTAGAPGQLLHPGDSLFVPWQPVDVLAIPAAAPWMKISEAVDFLRSVQPRVAVPIHQGLLSDNGLGIYYGRLKEMSHEGTEFRTLPAEDSVEI
ncbi:MBL fold metallo-hydrolase [Hoyosella altamirensis]|uniref:L-ascorbate metabolism protein UlaG (Beta-lactamase superfamily) n=1 Tax=Hoyosella altamirensis TaxID=616997 RepID=A0A839RL31_9ACTN|nr:MBL fold metallo-hydrolase [Hoyosella altamirensis]MBB3037405.1 L-ascorbate metabolism protein UlaG (beta-lactamase superfamily) [Hoyosella altamirensis]